MSICGDGVMLIANYKAQKSMSIARLRRALSFVINAPHNLSSVGDFNKEGEVTFTVLLKDFGIPYEEFKQLKEEIFSHFFVDIVGEILVRENIELFTQKLTGLDGKQYDGAVNHFEHRRFGMKIKNDIICFTFHASLIQDILTENFKDQIQI